MRPVRAVAPGIFRLDATPQTEIPHVNGTAPISRIVRQVAEQVPGERITLGQMAEAMGDRAFGILILICCLPALIPALATVFAVPMIVLGAQMGLGLRQPRLPGFIARQSIRRDDLLRLAEVSSSWLSRVERIVKPRPGFFVGPVGDRLVGWLAVYAGVMIVLPGPMTNAPPAAGTIVMALGVVESDNRVVGIGAALTLVGCLFATTVLLFLGWAAWQAVGMVFS
jgi:hypothetical protein